MKLNEIINKKKRKKESRATPRARWGKTFVVVLLLRGAGLTPEGELGRVPLRVA